MEKSKKLHGGMKLIVHITKITNSSNKRNTNLIRQRRSRQNILQSKRYASSFKTRSTLNQSFAVCTIKVLNFRSSSPSKAQLTSEAI